MKRTQQSALLAGLLAALALAACSSTPSGYNSDRMGASTAPPPVSSSTGGAAPVDSNSASGVPTGNSGTEGTTAGSMTHDAMGSGKMQSMLTPNALVLTIESMPRQSGIVASGSAVGSSGSAGTSGSSMGDDRIYRISLRMDDGSTRVVTQEKSPAFAIGERVNMSDGTISTVP